MKVLEHTHHCQHEHIMRDALLLSDIVPSLSIMARRRQRVNRHRESSFLTDKAFISTSRNTVLVTGML